MEGLPDAHTSAGSSRMFPRASFAVVYNCAVSLVFSRLMRVSERFMVAGFCLTTAEALAVKVPELAMISVEPLATEVTRPDSETVAISGFTEVHDAIGVCQSAPSIVLADRCNCTVSPKEENVMLDEDRERELRGGPIPSSQPATKLAIINSKVSSPNLRFITFRLLKGRMDVDDSYMLLVKMPAQVISQTELLALIVQESIFDCLSYHIQISMRCLCNLKLELR